MPSDPNWLFSTIAQSSAAIVAIIGGFITASILTLLAEKRNLTNQKAEKETRLDLLKTRETEEVEVYEAIRVDVFLNRIANDLKKEDELPPFEEIIYRYPGWNLNRDILKREYEKLSIQRIQAREFIEIHSELVDLNDFILFDEWVKGNKLDVSGCDYDLLEEEYYRFRTQREQKSEEDESENLPPLLKNMFSIKMPDITPLPSPQTTQWDLYRKQREDRESETARSRINTLKHEISLLVGEISNLESRINSFSYPPNLGWGIIVLAYLAVFGILFPVLIIAFEAFFNWARVSITTMFWLGIIAVFSYVVFQIRTLKK